MCLCVLSYMYCLLLPITEQARCNKPYVVFIDELDAVGETVKAGMRNGMEYGMEHGMEYGMEYGMGKR